MPQGDRPRSILGLVVGGSMILSSAALEPLHAPAVNDFDPFFVVFGVPGVLLLIASTSRRSAGRR